MNYDKVLTRKPFTEHMVTRVRPEDKERVIELAEITGLNRSEIWRVCLITPISLHSSDAEWQVVAEAKDY